MNIYHATPYDISATGFYFSDFEEYQGKAASHRNEYGDPVEEYEIQFIDGDNCSLFLALGVNQANLERWFDEFEAMAEYDAIRVIYLANDLGYDMADITQTRIDDVMLFEGTLREYVEDYITSTGMLSDLPETLNYYFNYDAFARDLESSGDITTIEINNTSYVVQDG